MDTPLDVFHYLYKNARRALEGERAHEEREAYLAEKRKLDEHYAYELKQRKAIEARRITLAMASSASILMRLSDAQPQYWLYEEPIYETQGLYKKRTVQTGTRQQIALEGWELPIDQLLLTPRDFYRDHYMPVLTIDENINGHPPLVWYKMLGSTVTKTSVHALSATPLSAEDMPWYMPEQTRSKRKELSMFDVGEVSPIRAKPSDEEIERLKTAVEESSLSGRARAQIELITREHARNNADYDAYKKARVEQRLQKAIAQVAAQHNILDLR